MEPETRAFVVWENPRGVESESEGWQCCFCCAKVRRLLTSPEHQTWGISLALEENEISFLEKQRFPGSLIWNASLQGMTGNQETLWTHYFCRLPLYGMHLTWEVNGMHSDYWQIFEETVLTSLFVLVMENDLYGVSVPPFAGIEIYPDEKETVSGFGLGKRWIFPSAVNPLIYLVV